MLTHRENRRAGWGFSALGVDPRSVEEVFISHTHHDHMSGLVDFLRINPVRIIRPRSAPVPQEAEVIRVKGPVEIHPRIFSTGELRN
ncbi:MAG: MBL fold metallo-hydrolase [Methanothrix sp.]|nr:MAG: MBL fold metallo-hydrolase [Methanothrix sp.]